jgi:hypothetical protein
VFANAGLYGWDKEAVDSLANVVVEAFLRTVDGEAATPASRSDLVVVQESEKSVAGLCSLLDGVLVPEPDDVFIPTCPAGPIGLRTLVFGSSLDPEGTPVGARVFQEPTRSKAGVSVPVRLKDLLDGILAVRAEVVAVQKTVDPELKLALRR